jgi:hypothetical protein
MTCKRSDKNSYKSVWTDERREEYSKKFLGENNPRYGVEWTEEQKLSASILKQKQYDEIDGYRHQVGSSNRGVKFSEERIEAMHGHRSSDSYSHPHTEDTKKLIGKKSAAKWTDEFKKSFRKIMEDNGHWIRLEDKEPYDLYYKDANWIGSMMEFLNEEELLALSKFGLFHQISNSKGWVRDHIVPRMVGYEFSLPVQLLRHPANLKFVSHGDNIKKGFVDRKLTETEKRDTIQHLFERIINFDQEWQEHEWCLEFIRSKE